LTECFRVTTIHFKALFYFAQGLIPAVQEVMPSVAHRYCAMHLWKNFTKNWKDKELRGVVWDCAKSTTASQFNRHMDRVKRLNKSAWEYLNKWPKEAWTRAYFKENSKVDNITNNNCEVFNAKIVNYRTKPILTMVEEVRCYIMRTMTTRKVKFAGRTGPLCPVQASRLEKELIESNKWTPTWTGPPRLSYQVQNGSIKVDVDLEAMTCACRYWQLSGKLLFACILMRLL